MDRVRLRIRIIRADYIFLRGTTYHNHHLDGVIGLLCVFITIISMDIPHIGIANLLYVFTSVDADFLLPIQTEKVGCRN